MPLSAEDQAELDALERELEDLEGKQAALLAEDIDYDDGVNEHISGTDVKDASLFVEKENSSDFNGVATGMTDDVVSTAVDQAQFKQSGCTNNEKQKKRTRVQLELAHDTEDDVEKVIGDISTELNESNVHILRAVVIKVGVQQARSMLEETIKLEAAGGMLTADSKRRRSPGGAFLQIAKRFMGSSSFAKICTRDTKRRKGEGPFRRAFRSSKRQRR